MTDKPYLEQPELHVKAPYRAAQLTYPGNARRALQDAMEDPTKTLFGIGHGIPSVFVTKLLASARPDFIWIDSEHAVYNRLELHDAIHAAQHHSEGSSFVIVRVPKHDEATLSTALDAGAAAIVIPHTESAEDVKRFIKDIYYPPIGERSFSPWTFTPGVSDRSLYSDDGFNMGTSNRHIILIAQVESVKGIANLDEIAAVEGVSGLMLGPGDFSADAGIPLKLGGDPHPVLLDAMTKLAAAGAKYNRALFGGVMSPDQIPMMIQQGFRMLTVTMDVWGMVGMVAGAIKGARELAQQAGAPPAKNGAQQENGDAKGE